MTGEVLKSSAPYTVGWCYGVRCIGDSHGSIHEDTEQTKMQEYAMMLVMSLYELKNRPLRQRATLTVLTSLFNSP